MSTADRPYQPDAPTGFDLQGHRGARGLAPENTLAAFRRALDLGVTTLELDTVISADGEVVVSHEPWMSAEICSHPDGRAVMPDEARRLRIYEMSYAEVARYDCGRRGHPRFSQQEAQAAIKPLLRDVIRLAEAYVREHGRSPIYYNVETKSTPDGDGIFHPAPDAFVHRIWDVVEAEGVARRFTLQSFDVRTLQVARQERHSIRLALLVADRGQEGLASYRQGIRTLGFIPHIYSPDYDLVDVKVIAQAHEDGALVIPWTVNERADMERLHGLGVDGLITDYPDLGVNFIESVEQGGGEHR